MKQIAEFARCARAKDGLQHNCRSCQKARRKKAVCSVDGCTRSHLARGLCTTHWNEWRNHATANDLARRKFQSPSDAFKGRTERGDGDCLIWTGITYDRTRNQYRARIKHNHREIHLGRFKSADAAMAAVAEARRHFFTHSDMDS